MSPPPLSLTAWPDVDVLLEIEGEWVEDLGESTAGVGNLGVGSGWCIWAGVRWMMSRSCGLGTSM